ncbi:MAG: ATPase, T2SS/T4P/T4SS family [Armatimonas sp.]
MRILAVEDDALTALMLHEALEKAGHELAVLRDPQKALTCLGLPDLECDAVLFGEADGISFCRQLRESTGLNAKVPFFIALNNDSLELRTEAQEVEVTSFLHFPLDAENVIEVLDAHKKGTLPSISELPLPVPEPVMLNNFVIISTAPETQAPPSTPPRIVVPDLSPLPSDDTTALVPTDALVPLKVNSGFGVRQKLGEILIRSGIITGYQLDEALSEQLASREKLGAILIKRGWATEGQIQLAYSHQVDVPFIEIDKAVIADELVSRIPREKAMRSLFIPVLPTEEERLQGDNHIRVALADPWNITAIDLVQQHTRARVIPVLADPESLRRVIEQIYLRHQGPDEEIVRALGTSLDGASPSEVFEDDDADASDDGPIARFVNQVIVEAVRRRASDIHIEPYKKDFEVRFRIDGLLVVAHTLPRQSYNALVSRIKVMGDMDIAEKRVPQDGRIALIVDERHIQFRVSCLPNQFGERVVMRILDKGATQKTLDQLDFSAVNFGHFAKLIKRPHGIILVTGPTGSGKTTTLYASLNAVMSPTMNIMTCEDPIEYEMDRISQSMVNPKAGLTFAAQLRAILRQDPDVVLVGEIRDGETAEVAFKAAMTGHLVLSTLHCNEAAGAAARLTDMGVEPFLIASGLAGSVAQRLVRRLCPHCRVLAEPDANERALLELLTGHPVDIPLIGKKVGCPKCNDMGTLGRISIHEVLVMNEEIQHLIIERAPTSALNEKAKETAGFVPMVYDGVEKVVNGLAYLEDVVKKMVNH